jgi:hypothetical protein
VRNEEEGKEISLKNVRNEEKIEEGYVAKFKTEII